MANIIDPYTNGYIISYENGDISLERIPTYQVNQQLVTVHTVLEGETLQSIAYKYYGDSGYWSLLADVNEIFNPFAELEKDMEIIIP